MKSWKFPVPSPHMCGYIGIVRGRNTSGMDRVASVGLITPNHTSEKVATKSYVIA